MDRCAVRSPRRPAFDGFSVPLQESSTVMISAWRPTIVSMVFKSNSQRGTPAGQSLISVGRRDQLAVQVWVCIEGARYNTPSLNNSTPLAQRQGNGDLGLPLHGWRNSKTGVRVVHRGLIDA